MRRNPISSRAAIALSVILFSCTVLTGISIGATGASAGNAAQGSRASQVRAANLPAATPTPCSNVAGWNFMANLPQPLTRALGIYFPDNGKFYALGGRPADSAGSDSQHIYEYDLASNSWLTKTALVPDNQTSNMVGGVINLAGTNYIMGVGGSAATQTTATSRVFLYNPMLDTVSTLTTDTWGGDSNGTTLPGGAAVVNNKLYVEGGYNINVAMTTAIWQFDPGQAAGSRWALKGGTLPAGAGYIPVTAIGNIIYNGGGSDYQGGTVVDTNHSYAYDTSSDSVTALATPIPRSTGETRAVNIGGQMWVLGGGRVPPNPSAEVDPYDPVSGNWLKGIPFNTPRRNLAADSDGSHIFLVGGYDATGSTVLNSLEVFTPVTCTPTPTVTDTPLPTDTPTSTNTPAPATVTPTDCANPFVDITGNVFFGAIHYLYCRGDVNGTDATHYSPAGTSTRGQFAKVVVLGFGTPFYTPSGTQDFSDVPPTYFAYLYIETGFHAGVLSGFDANTCQQHGQTNPCYLPNLAITRGQITKLVVNAAGYTLVTPGHQSFSDVPPSNVFYLAIETAHDKGVINGYPNGTFQPNANVRRDAMAQIVFKGVTTP